MSPESSGSPGHWHNIRAPYLVDLMDAFNDPSVDEIVIETSAQIGKTETLCNIIGYIISQNPGPTLYVLPTLSLAESFVKDRFVPLIRDCAVLADRVQLTIDKSRLVQDTLLHRTFKGGHFSLAGANSTASLSSRPIRFLLLDEVDRFPTNLQSEGDVVAIARKRTTAFYNAKTIMVSTPTVRNGSRIEQEFLQSDQRRYFVPCPHCGHFQILRLGKPTDDFGLKWDEGKPETAAYLCDGCHKPISHSAKARMILQGEWRATAEPKNKRTRGFHLNELYSPFVTWEAFAGSYLQAQVSPDTLRTFVNVSLGETYEDAEQNIQPSSLGLRAEEYDGRALLPERVLVLTCGIDVQGDRLELEVVGYGKAQESWGVERKALFGDTTQRPVWRQLEEFLKQKYKHASGVEMPIACTCIDTGFVTDNVYRYLQSHASDRVFGIKGMPGRGRPIVGKRIKTKLQRGSVRVFPVGVDSAKDQIYAHLQIDRPLDSAPYMHFPVHYRQEFYDQITAEKAITTKSKVGKTTRTYVKVRARNEALDCRVYSLAALALLGLDLDKIETPFEGAAPSKAVPVPKAPVSGSPVNEIVRRMRQVQHTGFVNSWR